MSNLPREYKESASDVARRRSLVASLLIILEAKVHRGESVASNQSNPVRVGPTKQNQTSTGRVSGFEVEVWHDGLGEHQVLRDRSPGVLLNKVEALQQRWAEKYAKRVEREDREARRRAGKDAAEEATRESQNALQASRDILSQALSTDIRVDWESLKGHASMTRKPKGTTSIRYGEETGKPLSYIPVSPRKEVRPTYKEPQLTLWDRITGKKEGKEKLARIAFEQAMHGWEQRQQSESERVNGQNSERQQVLDLEQKEWAAEEDKYTSHQDATNAEVDVLQRKYEEWTGSDIQTIEEHAELVLNASKYPDWIEVDFDLGYNGETKTIIVDYRLPREVSMPTIQVVTYVQARDELQQKFISKREQEQLYENVLHQLALRTMRELYATDEVAAFDAIVFNGWIESVNPATGQPSNNCIMSVQARRDEFFALNLESIDPRACYRALKGVSAAKLATLTPIRPILQMGTGDRRFVEARDVAQELSGDSNLATMDWEDFEHLVREIFEKEFVSQGGEVKVTQASRDGGVDAIAFDPDPIRGGKYVIQAKRYTRTVGVDAVRDLFGTVTHEGANRGILVTTSDYGPDSVSFAKDKPLTLINGSQLLSLLEKHGHQARIDLKEARDMRAEGSS